MTTPQNMIVLLITSFFLFACGSDDGSGENSLISNSVDLQYTLDAGNCLESENSESSVIYENANNYAKTLIWNCATYDVYS